MRRALVLALALASLTVRAPAEELRAGFGVAELPTPPGSALAGYGGLFENTAEGVLDPPQVLALVLEQASLRVAILAFDLLLIRPELRAELLRSEAAHDLDGLVLVATHTHAGPGGYVPGWLAGRVTGARHRPDASAGMAAAGARALARATADLSPARAGARSSAFSLAQNRRTASGRRETELALLRIEPASARPIVLVAYGAHPTVLSARNHSFSADYPGALRRWLDARGWQAQFLQGPLGDQEPDARLASPEAESTAIEAREVEAVGAALGGAVLETLAETVSRPGVALRFAEREVEAPWLRPRRGCALWWFSPISRPALRRLTSPRVRIQALRLGEARMVFVPAEPTAEVGMALRAATGHSTVIALANDWLGYFVSAQQYRRGGYEACMSLTGPGGADWLVREAAATAARLEVGP